MNTLLFAALALSLAAPAPAQTPKSKPVAKRPLLLAHYMPWFDADPDAKRFGWHWTMGKRDPNKADATGKREIAAHDYPAIGAYDSGDPDVLEYHVLLMKIAGIDGVIADWYGDTDLYDYAAVNRNTAATLAWAKKAGLTFAVCYEDQTVPKLVDAGKVPGGDTTKYVQGVLSRLETGWIADPAYLRLQGKPAFLVFGNPAEPHVDWSAVLAPPLKPRCLLLAGYPPCARRRSVRMGQPAPRRGGETPTDSMPPRRMKPRLCRSRTPASVITTRRQVSANPTESSSDAAAKRWRKR